MGLLSIILKYIVIQGYSPTEDLLELGVDATKCILKIKNENLDKKLKEAGLTGDQIKTVKSILSESTSRFIPNTPADIYKYNADYTIISRHIFNAYKNEQESGNPLTKSAICLTDETVNEQIIKGLYFYVQKAVDVYLKTSEYIAFLTREQTKTKEAVNSLIAHGEPNQSESIEKSQAERINEYQKYVIGRYTERSENNTLLGEESLSDLYIKPCYYKSIDEVNDIEPLIEEFISKEDSHVLWIVGEPGHGKTSMCIKAVADYVTNTHYQLAKGVFWFRLNPQNINVVENSTLKLKKLFSWGAIDGYREMMFDPNVIRGSLVFMDGFDELKATLDVNNISISQFNVQLNQIAEQNQLHIVVTSRTRALEETSLKDESLKRGNFKITCRFSDGSLRINNVKLMAPLSREQQVAWIDKLIRYRKDNQFDISEIEEYRKSFHSLQENVDIADLLEVPILLRMIVQNCYKPSSRDRVKLYRELFDATLMRQDLYKQREQLHLIYRKIAFKIFAYDDDCTVINKLEFASLKVNDAYLYQYYLHTPELPHLKSDMYYVTFLHRSFYQYFLSEFIFEKLMKVNDLQSGENFLKFLWARRIDQYVLDNLRLMMKSDYPGYTWLIKAIDNTDCILPEYAYVSDAKEPIGNLDKAINTFGNAISIISYILQQETKKQLLLSKRIVSLFSIYKCKRVSLIGFSLSSTDLREAKLCSADLRLADLSSADLRSADLSSADLRSANLRFAKLESSNFTLADLSSADLEFADLKNANLSLADLSSINLNSGDLQYANLEDAELNHASLLFVDLSDANLKSADLIDANLRCANLKFADLSGADLRSANLSNTNLMSANLTGALINKAKMNGANVENTKVTKKQYDYISKQHVKNLYKIIIVDDD